MQPIHQNAGEGQQHNHAAETGITMTPNRAEVIEFFRTTLSGRIHLVAIIPDGGTQGRDFGTDAAAATDWAIGRNREGKGVYYTVNRVRPGINKKPTKADMTAVRFAHVDVDPPKDGTTWDPEEAYARLATASPQPTIICWSGNGWHALWRAEGVPLEGIEAINKGLIAKFSGDPGTHNLDRLLRVPGLVNYPNKKKAAAGRGAAMARIASKDDGTTYSASQLLAAFPAPAEKPKPTPVAGAPAMDGPLLTADDLDLTPNDYIRDLIDAPQGADGSSDTLALAGAMVRDGYDDQAIAGILLNPVNAISTHCLEEVDPKRAAERAIAKARADDVASGARLADFQAYLPLHTYIFAPTGEHWPAASVNSRFSPVLVRKRNGQPVLDAKGKPKRQPPAAWLDNNQAVEQVTWAPGQPQIVRDRLISDGSWVNHPGCNVFNLYCPPTAPLGDAQLAGPWIDHVHCVYPDDAEHLIKWLAHRVQRPAEKINHAIVLGGSQGIGKDTILEPVKAAIGPWNFAEVSPKQMLGRFNSYVKSVILRVSEARDLGDVDRFAFYDHMKTYTAAPPDVLRVDEKHLREHSVFNVCGVIITTNHKLDGIYLPPDDRRHYVAWSESTREAFTKEYWNELYGWYTSGGTGHVAAYLSGLSLADFDPKAPPPKTRAFWEIVGASQAPEDAEMADAIEKLNSPDALTIGQLTAASDCRLAEWLKDRRNYRKFPHRLSECGYVAVRNPGPKDGSYKVGGKRQVIYAKKSLTAVDAQVAVVALQAAVAAKSGISV